MYHVSTYMYAHMLQTILLQNMYQNPNNQTQNPGVQPCESLSLSCCLKLQYVPSPPPPLFLSVSWRRTNTLWYILWGELDYLPHWFMWLYMYSMCVCKTISHDSSLTLSPFILFFTEQDVFVECDEKVSQHAFVCYFVASPILPSCHNSPFHLL